jgi:ABC-type cobalamin transport system ATPase subunit
MFGIVRIGLGGWILLLPTIEGAGFTTLSAVLAGLLFVSGAIGLAFAPQTRGRDLEDADREGLRSHPPVAVEQA